jgi:DNA-binding response OmpR family regulator
LEAEKILEREPDIQIAILDWMMPVMDGIELCRSLQTKKNAPYILMITGIGTEADLRAPIMQAGANDYLIKPFIPDILWWKLLAATRFLKNRRCARAVEHMKILIADDDMLFRTVLRNSLIQWEHQVFEAANGQEAIQLLQQQTGINIAILDRNMPGINGLELCHDLHEKKIVPYILIASGSKTDQEIREGMEAGANDYLCKPFTLEMLQSRLLAAAHFMETSAGSNH